jgi:hypothetical protein
MRLCREALAGVAPFDDVLGWRREAEPGSGHVRRQLTRFNTGNAHA